MNVNESIIQNEYEKDRIRGLHLVVVIVLTIATAAVTGESFLMGWELFMLPLIVVGLAAAWWLHLTQTLSDNARYYIYVILIYIVMFFHGIHPTSLFDVAITTNLSILLFSQADDEKVIRAGVAVYSSMLLYHLWMAFGGAGFATDSLTVSRMALHIFSVVITSRLAITIIKRRKNDTRNYNIILKQMVDVNTRTENFMANISHELRTPINVVTGMTSLLLTEEEDEKKLSDLQSVNRAGRRLFDQIGGILDYTEIDTGRLILNEENYMMPSIINDLINELSVFDKRKKLEIIFDMDAGLPRLLFGDARRIKKILYQLIDNAFKFTKEGGIYVKIYGMKREYGINLCIDVTDTGIGISDEEKSRIIQGFYQSDAGRDRMAGGIGLGLPVVYGFVHSMHGFVRIDSAKGKGTKVHVSIPQTVADPTVSISINDPESLCIACYLRPEKYRHPAIRDYYSELISNMAKGLKVNLHKIAKRDDLNKVFNTYAVTHVFIGVEEYLEARDYFEEMAKRAKVIVVADNEFVQPADTQTHLIKKPFYILPVAAALNTEGLSSELDDIARDNLQPIFAGVKALVVDDEEMNLVVASGIFKNYKMDVDTAGSGAVAISMCEEKDYDIVFMDHMMPEMDGIEAMKHIRTQSEVKGHTPAIVALTANAVSGARQMFLEEGFDGFIAKPIDIVELVRVLKIVVPQSKIQYIPKTEERSYRKTYADKFIDYEKALSYCDGDKDLLTSLLREFSDQRKSNIAILKGEQSNGKSLPDIEISRLKNEALLLGLTALYDLLNDIDIKDMTISGKDGSDLKNGIDIIDAIDECINNSLNEYMAIGGVL